MNIFSINDLIIYKTKYNKIRLGEKHDNGYIILDIPDIIYDLFISCGELSINNSFENGFINKYNIPCEVFNINFDKLDNKSENTSDKINYNNKYINNINNDIYTNLDNYLNKYKNIFIKLDIEGNEFIWLDYLNETQLNNISQLVIEFHYYSDKYKNLNIFSKINKFFYLVHLHPNNCRTYNNNSGTFDYNSYNIPWVFECTYINKKYIDTIKLNNSLVPDEKIDYKNVIHFNDLNINYFPYKFRYDKLITPIPPNSGPGNQIISIKECLIISKLLKKTCIIPPIREHYIKSNIIYYNFNDIFKLKLPDIIIDDNTYRFFNNIDKYTNRYCIHPTFLYNKMLHENIIKNNKSKQILLNNKFIKNTDDLSELKNINDNLIIIKHLFNNVHINNSGINGDFSSTFNKNFKNIYEDICCKWDFSDNIKKIGNEYIKNTLKNKKYIAIHIRLPDILDKPIEEYTNNDYNSNRIVKLISDLNNSYDTPIFIASNNINYLKKIGIIAEFFKNEHKYNSFIEQYICSMSYNFYYLNLENTRYNKLHNRSTWTSFVIDYRFFFLQRFSNNNLIFNINNNIQYIFKDNHIIEDENFIIIKNLYYKNTIKNILDFISNKESFDSRVGDGVNKKHKIRKDTFLLYEDIKYNNYDNIFFDNIKYIVNKKFNIDLKYRERYKIGSYNGYDKGFYNPHTDKYGYLNRQISCIVCLSPKENYEGGLFCFVDLNKKFKFDIGDIILFKSELLHGVQPVLNGLRQVIITFLWDEFSENIRLPDENKKKDNVEYNYLPVYNNCI